MTDLPDSVRTTLEIDLASQRHYLKGDQDDVAEFGKLLEDASRRRDERLIKIADLETALGKEPVT